MHVTGNAGSNALMSASVNVAPGRSCAPISMICSAARFPSGGIRLILEDETNCRGTRAKPNAAPFGRYGKRGALRRDV